MALRKLTFILFILVCQNYLDYFMLDFEHVLSKVIRVFNAPKNNDLRAGTGGIIYEGQEYFAFGYRNNIINIF